MADDQGSEQEDAQVRPDDASPTSADTDAAPARDAKADLQAEDPGRAEPEPEPEPEPAPETKAAVTAPAPVRRRASRLWWALPIVMLVEFYVYGHNGRLEICVGKEGDTDFSLVGQERTDANRWKFPRCETRENLGLRSQQEERVKEGIEAACRGATIFRNQGEAKVCVAGEQGWQHRVDGSFVPPWDPAYYRHLFWFLQ